MFGALLALAFAVAPAQDTARVVVVATTDVHGHATDRDYLAGTAFPGGLVRVAAVVDSLRKRYAGQLVVVDAGDLIQGDPFATFFATIAPRDPHPVLDAMNLVGYDAATPGNHEFNFGLATLHRAIAGAAFPYVSGNIRTLPADTGMFHPYVTVRRGAVRVAIAGFTTPGVMVWDRDSVRGRVRVDPIAKDAPRILREMRKDADLSVVLIHSGMDERSSYDTTGIGGENVAASLAAMPDKPDLVVVGHSHREMRDSVLNGVHFVQPRNWAQSVSVVHLTLVQDGRRWRVARVQADLVQLAKQAPSPRVAARLAGPDRQVRDWVDAPLGDAADSTSTRLARAEPTPLIQFINAVQRKRARSDLSATAAFSTRVMVQPGLLTLAKVAALYPYENTLRAVKLSGAALRAYLEQSARYFLVDAFGNVHLNDSIPGYNYDIVSGATYDIDLSRPVGDRIRNLAVRGRVVAPTDSFTLALNNYRQSGGGGFDMLRDAPLVYDKGESIRDLLVDAVRTANGFDPAKYRERNWRIVPETAAAQVRALFTDAPRLAAVGAPGGAGRPPAVAGDSIMLRILSINDLHGALEPKVYDWSKDRAVGGVAVLKAAFDSAEARCKCPTIRLDAGDEMQGTLISNLSWGRATVAALNAVGIQAAALGNHDFDWGPDTLRARMREAKYPWLAVNVIDSSTGVRADWVKGWTMLRVRNLNVAVVGFVTGETKGIVKADRVAGLQFPGGATLIKQALAEARAQQPDVTLLVAHSGSICNQDSCSGEILDLARELGPGSVDAIISGHTHRAIIDTSTGIPIIQARSSGTAFGVLDLIRRSDGTRGVQLELRTPYADEVTPDRAVTALLEQATAPSRAMAARVIARTKLPLPKSGEEGQYALGNLVADAQRTAARADVAVMNNTGIRGTGLAAGPITYEQAFGVNPFANEIVKLDVTGTVLKQVLERGVQGGTPSIHVSGLTMVYDSTRKAGDRVRSVRLADGRKFEPTRRYTLAINDFLAGGGSGYTMLPKVPVLGRFGTDLDAFVAYLSRLPQPVDAPDRPRVVQAGSAQTN